MTPNTFEALKLAKEAGRLKLSGGYAWRIKERNSDVFVSMSERAGVSDERGAGFWSLAWMQSDAFRAGTSGYVVPDVLSTGVRFA